MNWVFLKFVSSKHVFNHMERIARIHAVNTVTIRTVTNLTEVVWLVVQTGFMASGAIKVNIN